MITGHPLLADGIAQSIDDLAKKAKLGGQLVRLQPTGFEQFAFWITALAPLLLLLGIVCAYLEFKIPGATLPGVVAGIFFVLFFFRPYFGGLAGWGGAGFFLLRGYPPLIEEYFFPHSLHHLWVVCGF